MKYHLSIPFGNASSVFILVNLNPAAGKAQRIHPIPKRLQYLFEYLSIIP
jgi:hypothetical protein